MARGDHVTLRKRGRLDRTPFEKKMSCRTISPFLLKVFIINSRSLVTNQDKDTEIIDKGIETYHLSLRMAPQVASDAPSFLFCLSTSRDYILPGLEWSVGRAPSNDLVLKHEQISASYSCVRGLHSVTQHHSISYQGNLHCQIKRSGRAGFGHLILDTSRNGTLVNSFLVGNGRKRYLRSGDKISLSGVAGKLGSLIYTVHLHQIISEFLYYQIEQTLQPTSIWTKYIYGQE